jgi:hypothetical protein
MLPILDIGRAHFYNHGSLTADSCVKQSIYVEILVTAKTL